MVGRDEFHFEVFICKGSRAAFSFCVLFFLLTPARADTIVVFAASGNHIFQKSGKTRGIPLGGTITINVTSGQVVSIDFNAPPNLISIDTQSVGTYNGYVEIFDAFLTSTSHQVTAIHILLPTASLIGYTGGYICSTSHPCVNAVTGVSDTSFYNDGLEGERFIDGALTPLSPTRSQAV